MLLESPTVVAVLLGGVFGGGVSSAGGVHSFCIWREFFFSCIFFFFELDTKQALLPHLPL